MCAVHFERNCGTVNGNRDRPLKTQPNSVETFVGLVEWFGGGGSVHDRSSRETEARQLQPVFGFIR